MRTVEYNRESAVQYALQWAYSRNLCITIFRGLAATAPTLRRSAYMREASK